MNRFVPLLLVIAVAVGSAAAQQQHAPMSVSTAVQSTLAGTRITITHAAHPDAPELVKVTAGATPKPENNPEVFPGDTVYVERTGVIFVVGDVVRPGGFPMDHDGQLSILQAIALAQGTT